jgi:hypothetical protein
MLSSAGDGTGGEGGTVADAPDWTEVVAAATRAPSIHNTQPWLFTGSEDRLEVFYDPERSLPVLDPTHRQQVISCGVAVEFAAVALRAAGLEVEVEVVPGREHPDHLATVRVTGERAASAEDRALAAAIGARHTQRAAFEDRAVPSGLVDQLQAEAGAYGVWLEAVSRSDAELAVVALLNRAEEVEQGEPAYRAELEKWLRTEPGAPDGIPVEAVPGEDPATRPTGSSATSSSASGCRARPRSRTTTTRRRRWSGRPSCCWAPPVTTGPPGCRRAARSAGCCCGRRRPVSRPRH